MTLSFFSMYDHKKQTSDNKADAFEAIVQLNHI